MPTIRFTSSDEQATKTIADLQAKVARLNDELKSTGRQAASSGKHVKDSFGGTALKELQNYVTGLVTLTAAIGAAKIAFAAMAAERQRASGGMTEAMPPIAQLATVSGGSAQRMADLIKAVRASQLETGMTATDAARLQFQLESVGLGAERQRFAKLRLAGLDAGRLAESTSTMRAAFGAQAGTVEQMLDMLMMGAAASKTTAEMFGGAASVSAKPVQAIGGTPAEAIASLSIMSRATKSAEVAATQQRALAEVIAEKGLGGQGLLAGVEAIRKDLDRLKTQPALTQLEQMERAQNLPAAQRAAQRMAGGRMLTDREMAALRKEEEFAAREAAAANFEQRLLAYFGRMEGLAGYRAITQDIGEITQLAGQLGKEQTRAGMADRIIQAALSQPEVAPVIARDRASQARAIAEEAAVGGEALFSEQMRQDVASRMLRRTQGMGIAGGLIRAGSDIEMQTMQNLGASGTALGAVEIVNQQLGQAAVKLLEAAGVWQRAAVRASGGPTRARREEDR